MRVLWCYRIPRQRSHGQIVEMLRIKWLKSVSALVGGAPLCLSARRSVSGAGRYRLY